MISALAVLGGLLQLPDLPAPVREQLRGCAAIEAFVRTGLVAQDESHTDEKTVMLAFDEERPLRVQFRSAETSSRPSVAGLMKYREDEWTKR